MQKAISISIIVGSLTLFLAGCVTQIGTRYSATYPSNKVSRDIIITIDGTGNNQYSRTNAARMYELIDNNGRENVSTYYAEGVGTDLRYVGAATGLGLDDDVRNAYQFLAEEWDRDSRVFFNGFSRGAYSVRVLGGLVAVAGIPDLDGLSTKEKKRRVKKIFKAYKTRPRNDETEKDQFIRRRSRLAALGYEYKAPGENVPIDAMFIWDTVEAIGLPDRTTSPGETNRAYLDTVCNVYSVFHALSIDDNREYSWTALSSAHWKRKELCPNWKPQIEEVWFSGAHADVGGSYSNNQRTHGFLPGNSLNWMIVRAKKYGLVSPTSRAFADPYGPIHDAKAFSKAYSFVYRNFRNPYEWTKMVVKDEVYPKPIPLVHKSVDQRLRKVILLDKQHSFCAKRTKDELVVYCSEDLLKMYFIQDGLDKNKSGKCLEKNFQYSASGSKKQIGFKVAQNPDCLRLVGDEKASRDHSGRRWLSLDQRVSRY